MNRIVRAIDAVRFAHRHPTGFVACEFVEALFE